ncbi:MAG: APC family permease [Candidatus Nitrosocosmicus sp.]
MRKLVNIADEPKSPHKTIPKALLISNIVTTIIYILVSVTSISLVGWNELYISTGLLAAATKKAGRNAVVVLLSAIGLFATTNTVLMILISGSREIFGISNTMKSQLSKYLTKVHVKRKTPRVCIAITMFAAIIIVQVFEACLFLIAGVSVFCVLIVYRRIINITMISLRYLKNAQVRHLVSPISIEIFPLIPGLRIIFWIVILIQIHHNIIKNASICIAAIFLLIFVIIKSINCLNSKRVRNAN